MKKTPLNILQEYWKHDSFRPMQEEIIQAVLDGKDALALLPTGGGKSICFQIPGLMLEGVCLVISPLIALMKDQAENLIEKGISVATIHSGLSYYDVKCILQDAVEGDYQFIYLSPERLETPLFKDYLPYLNISLLVVDEAHCISQWGYDFRPPYLRIAAIRSELEDVPMIALTASATPLVQKDIIAKLALKDATIFKQSFLKPNLSYSVFQVDSKINKLLEVLQSVSGSSIVYCNSRRQTKEIAELLLLHNISADFYHAGLSAQERTDKQDAWIKNNTRVIACTNAFGLGIDKPDVRTVIHYDAPECLENYYQEAGRAGRDGKKAYAVLLFHSDDISQLKALPDKRYPPIPLIKKIYQAIADFIQLPIGLGEGQFFDFDLSEFIRNFKLDSYTVTSVLKVLEQEGHCSFSENVFLPAQLSFTTDKETLNDFELAYPQWEMLLKTLLRTYEGIIDNRVSIHEKQLSRILRIPVENIVEQLLAIQAFGILEYLPLKETPQIHFLLNRAPADYLSIDQDKYLARKKQYEIRLAAMLNYLENNDVCRSNAITEYFGEPTDKACGICNNCLAKKKKELSPAEFKAIEKTITPYLIIGTNVGDLLIQCSEFSSEKIWQALKFMETEQRIRINEQGIVINC